MVSCGIALRNKDGKYLFVQATGNNRERCFGVPKGVVNEGEDFEECAKREFFEETNNKINGDVCLVYDEDPNNEHISTVNKKYLKIFLAYGEFDFDNFKSNTCIIKVNGEDVEIPEVCNPTFFTLEEAKKKCFFSQIKLVEELEKLENNSYSYIHK